MTIDKWSIAESHLIDIFVRLNHVNDIIIITMLIKVTKTIVQLTK